MDSTFYDKFYSQMTKGAFIGMAKATPETFQLSIHVPESITHVKRLHVERGSVTLYEEFVDKISALKQQINYVQSYSSFVQDLLLMILRI